MASSSRIQNGSLESGFNDSPGPSNKRRKLDNAAAFPCLVCKEPFRRRADLWEHLTSKEVGVNVFVCLDCSHGFCKERLLRVHVCNGADPNSTNDQRTALSVFCHVIACEECGLCVPLVNIENPGWKSYSSLCGHSSRSFRKITLYTWTSDAICFIKSDLSKPLIAHIDLGPAVTEGVPIACDICGERYSGVDEVEMHISQNHRDEVTPIQCEECQIKFYSSVRMEQHMNEKHRRGEWNMMDFLKNVSVEEPFMEKPMVGRNDSYINCDLCGENFLGTRFNQHDCTVNYMRRFLLNGKVIYVPAVKLMDCKIDMSQQDPMLISLHEKSHRYMDLCLRFYFPVIAPRIEDFKDDRVYSCKHCERIFISPTLFREHVMEVFQEQKVDFAWPKTGARNQDPLDHCGTAITIVETGFICPKAGCCSKWCSTVGLEWHLGNVHADTFQPLTIPILAPDSPVKKQAEESPCAICGERLFRSKAEMQAHVRDCHLFPCNNCGTCFVSQKKLDYHKRQTSCNDKPPPMCYCPICKEVFKLLSDYYSHLISQHPGEANHDEVLGQILPKCALFLQAKVVTSDTPVNFMALNGVHMTKQEDLLYESFDLGESNSGGISGEAATDDCDVVVTPSSQDQNFHTANGDDEVLFCEPSEYSTSSRKPTHGCPHCSKMFYTLLAAEEHSKTHEYDAGLNTVEVLPVPSNTSVYICRLCCVAYEYLPDYVEHTKKHKRIIDCHFCSALCLNPQNLETHEESHRMNKIAFGCATCLKAFRHETALMLHLSREHAVSVIWFCKLCGLGNTKYEYMAHHSCDGRMVTDVPIFATSKKKLHFQPRSDGVVNGASSSTKSDDVSECVHRSFLACKDNCLACESCGTIVTAATYLLTHSQITKGDDKMRLILVEHNAERNLIFSHPSSRRMKSCLVFAPRMPPATGGVRLLLPKAMASTPRVLLPAPPNPLAGPRPVLSAAMNQPIGQRPIMPAANQPINLRPMFSSVNHAIGPRPLLAARPNQAVGPRVLMPTPNSSVAPRPLLQVPQCSSNAARPVAPKLPKINPNMVQRHFY